VLIREETEEFFVKLRIFVSDQRRWPKDLGKGRRQLSTVSFHKRAIHDASL
jgi:hypothetical protein